ncbi:hypothetical protein Ahy_B09g098120 [Arachis hypogaea]|uniref:Putative plant transposon protein domain-containing protein n=1 Tax=Arachis hypogaea TaxID=3818 RepID=A0A444XQP7_ARAHY|nr:hypothetical protein Ahy_B09g098120 [Arachis hypogaea]
MASSSSKRRKGKEPMEQRPFDEKKFRTYYHALQYGWMVDKEIVYELGFQVRKTECPEITKKVEKRRWELLTDPVTRVNTNLVREFYANAVRYDKADESYTSFVRGKTVDFSPMSYPSTIFRLCDKAGVVFEDEDPEWIKEGILITVRRMNAVASPLPQRKPRKRPVNQVVEGQDLEEQAPSTLNMHQLQEAIDGLSRQYWANQEAQKELQLQMMNCLEESFARWTNQQGEWEKQRMERQLEQGK